MHGLASILASTKLFRTITNVCVFCTFTADGGLSGKGVHSFVVEDGLQVSFDLYWDQ